MSHAIISNAFAQQLSWRIHTFSILHHSGTKRYIRPFFRLYEWECGQPWYRTRHGYILQGREREPPNAALVCSDHDTRTAGSNEKVLQVAFFNKQTFERIQSPQSWCSTCRWWECSRTWGPCALFPAGGGTSIHPRAAKEIRRESIIGIMGYLNELRASTSSRARTGKDIKHAKVQLAARRCKLRNPSHAESARVSWPYVSYSALQKSIHARSSIYHTFIIQRWYRKKKIH